MFNICYDLNCVANKSNEKNSNNHNIYDNFSKALKGNDKAIEGKTTTFIGIIKINNNSPLEVECFNEFEKVYKGVFTNGQKRLILTKWETWKTAYLKNKCVEAFIGTGVFQLQKLIERQICYYSTEEDEFIFGPDREKTSDDINSKWTRFKNGWKAAEYAIF